MWGKHIPVAQLVEHPKQKPIYSVVNIFSEKKSNLKRGVISSSLVGDAIFFKIVADIGYKLSCKIPIDNLS